MYICIQRLKEGATVTTVVNMAYITFIDGIVLIPMAANIDVREAWMLIVIYRKSRELLNDLVTPSKEKLHC